MGIGVSIMGARLVYPSSAYAHNINLLKAREVIRTYARGVRDQSGGKYLHFSTSCVDAFAGHHSHIVRCRVDYQNAADTEKGVYTCRETIEVKMLPHDSRASGLNYTLYAYHTSSPPCGSRELKGTGLN